MNFFYRIIAIVYKSYDDKGLDIPYFRTIITVIFSLFLHIVQIGLLFDIPSNSLLPWGPNENKGLERLKATLYFTIPIIVVALIFNKSKLDKIVVSDRQIRKGRKYLPIYLTFSIVLLCVLLVIHGVRSGTIHL